MNVITRPGTDLNGGWIITPLGLGHGWMITSRIAWIQLLAHALMGAQDWCLLIMVGVVYMHVVMQWLWVWWQQGFYWTRTKVYYAQVWNYSYNIFCQSVCMLMWPHARESASMVASYFWLCVYILWNHEAMILNVKTIITRFILIILNLNKTVSKRHEVSCSKTSACSVHSDPRKHPMAY